ncbi:hypothetical protein JZ751_019977 [Albula glossodonta]|uniref:mitogen-activated protein kinase n=1 Tax=Albula glossodonta TaxID=121402 RepID=A0A8T2MZR9_9TELE|nr:hypothetical protein JZ751_019977 [Albula glossodonta]
MKNSGKSSYTAVKNPSNSSISLRIHNISESDLGLFYCSTGTENDFIGSEIILFQKENSITSSTFPTSITSSTSWSSSPPCVNATEAQGQCWVLLVSVCPVCAVVTAVLSSACVYWICRRNAAKNPSNSSISLRIHNISESDLGLFYCSTGTENDFIGSEIILFQKENSITSSTSWSSSPPCVNATEAQGQCWVLLVSVCPVCAVVTAVLFSACVYWICRRKGTACCEIQQTASRDEAQEDGGVNYATVNIPKLSKRPSDLGLFYCSTGTENDFIGSEIILFQKENSITSSTFPTSITSSTSWSSSPPCVNATEAQGQCWVLLVSVCPVCAVVTAVFSSACISWTCHRKEFELLLSEDQTAGDVFTTVMFKSQNPEGQQEFWKSSAERQRAADMASPVKTGFHRLEIHKTTWEVPERYTTLKPVGSGAYGTVCSATDQKTNEKVAIKKLYRPFQSLIHAKRAYRELRLLRHIQHENVICLLNVFTPDSSLEKFQTFISIQQGSFTGTSFIGVKWLFVNILDFGLARHTESEMTGYVVTRWYRAPEVIFNWMHYSQTGIDQLKKILSLTGTPQPSLVLEAMLVLDPEERMTAKQGLSHLYLAEFHDPEAEPDSQSYDDSFESLELAVGEWKTVHRPISLTAAVKQAVHRDRAPAGSIHVCAHGTHTQLQAPLLPQVPPPAAPPCSPARGATHRSSSQVHTPLTGMMAELLAFRLICQSCSEHVQYAATLTPAGLHMHFAERWRGVQHYSIDKANDDADIVPVFPACRSLMEGSAVFSGLMRTAPPANDCPALQK